MGEIRAIGLFAFSCLIAAITEALPAWLIIFSLAGIVLKFWRNARIPPILLYSLIVLAFSYLAWDAPKVWHRTTAASAFVVATLFYVLSPAHKHRVMRFHAGLFSLLVSVLIIPKDSYPILVYLALTLLLCASLIAHHSSLNNSFALKSMGKSIGRLALPLSLMMAPIYYFFPDIEEPRSRAQTSGIANELEPGRISSLALSDRLAFRVKFIGQIPDRSQLYWRTDVFEKSSGLRWTRDSGEVPVDFITNREQGIAYEIMLDDQLDGLLPMLEHTMNLEGMEDAVITFKSKARTARSTTNFVKAAAKLGNSFPAEEPRLAQIEPSSSRLRMLVGELKHLSTKERVDRILGIFQGFKYTLNPGVLSNDDKLDEFMFDSQKGYCEHFAASFASILRMAGSPARVVVGYVGGIRLGQTQYFQVSNASAHAWSEVWYEGAWHRVDPASYAIGGESIGQGQSNALKVALAWLAFQSEHALIWLKDWAQDLGLIWIAIAVIGVGLLSLQIYRVTHRTGKSPRFERLTLRLIRQLEAKGHIRGTGETVAHYFKRVDQRLSSVAELYNARKFDENQGLEPDLIAGIREGLELSRSIPVSGSKNDNQGASRS